MFVFIPLSLVIKVNNSLFWLAYFQEYDKWSKMIWQNKF